MIEYIFAAEFDLEKGVCIRSCCPSKPKLLDENYLASYMIPDGAHKREFDITNFKIKLQNDSSSELINLLRHEFNTRKPTICLYKKKAHWQPLLKPNLTKEFYEVTLISDHIHIQSSKEQKGLNIPIGQIQEISLLFDSFVSLTLNDEVYGLEFSDSKNASLFESFLQSYNKQKSSNSPVSERCFYFYNVMRMTKSKEFKRGSLIRSIAICSTTINLFHRVADLLLPYLDAFVRMPTNLEQNDLNSLKGVLYSALQAINIKIREFTLRQLYISPTEINYQDFEEPSSLFKGIETNAKTPTEPSLMEFVNIFKEKTMSIYLHILSGHKVLFVSSERSCRAICRIVQATQYLVAPLNITSRTLPYEHLSNIAFINIEGYIAGVSNPIFKMRNKWWDICCDITDGTILDNYVKPANRVDLEQFEDKIQTIDNEFVNDILKRLKDNNMKEDQLRNCFYNYTKNFIDFSTNSSNMIDYQKEDKNLLDCFELKSNKWRKSWTFSLYENSLAKVRETLKVVFGEKYLDVNTALNNFSEKKSFSDIELFKGYTVLVENLKDSIRLYTFLKYLYFRKGEISVLTSGLFSSNSDIRKKTVELLMFLEGSEYKKTFYSSVNYYTLAVYETLKENHLKSKVN